MSKIVITRQQESELPAIVNLQFINKNADYQQGSQQARRLSVLSIQKVDINCPIVFDDTTARNIAEKLMYNVWVERDRFTIKLPHKYAYLEPTDVFTVVDSEVGFSYDVRIVKRTESRSGSIDFECVADFAPSYLQNAITTVASVVTQVPLVSSATVSQFMDLPVLREVDAGTGFYLPLAGVTDVWAGGAVYQSIDGGATYNPYETSSTAATMGGTTTKLGTWTDATVFDNQNSIFVTLDSGSLSSTTDAALLTGSNLIAIASGSGWEVLQFKTATLQAPVPPETRDTYKLTGFWRGHFGTEWAIPGHAIGNKFVLLDVNSVQRTHLSNAQIGVALLYKTLTVGAALGSATPQSVTNTGIALKPYAPVNLTATGAPSDCVISWTRRLRVGESPPDAELYDVEIWSAGYTTLKRTFSSVTSPTVTYTTAQQTTDFGGVQSNIYFKVFQRNPVVGRGYEARGSTPFTFTGTAYTASVTEAATAADLVANKLTASITESAAAADLVANSLAASITEAGTATDSEHW